MARTDSAAPGGAERAQEARETSVARGPSRVSARTTRERIRTVVVKDHERIAVLVAQRIAALINAHDAAGKRSVLGLATGSTPIGVYRELIRMHKEEELSFANVVTFNLDEYYPMPPDSIHAYHRYMWENLFEHINIAKQNVHLPRGDIARMVLFEGSRRLALGLVAGGLLAAWLTPRLALFLFQVATEPRDVRPAHLLRVQLEHARQLLHEAGRVHERRQAREVVFLDRAQVRDRDLGALADID